LNQVDGRVFKDRRGLKDRRVLQDRRKPPTPASSQFKFWWQRKTLRSEVDRKKSGYVDLYSGGLLFLIILILGLDILDSLFTKMVLDLKGWELNPIVRAVIELYRDRFWVSKVAILSIPLILLCVHSKFRLAMSVILAICFIKIGVLLYQIF
jgi:hypothetical protein